MARIGNSPLWARPFLSIWQALVGLGDIWDSSSAQTAFENDELRSTSAGAPIRVAFRNTTPLTLILCWVNEKGVLEHFRCLEPNQGSLSDVIAPTDHLERTYLGHAFVVGTCSDLKNSKAEGKLDTVLAGYRPTKLGKQDNEGDPYLHVVTFSEPPSGMCTPKAPAKVGCKVDVTVQLEELDRTPIDTSGKRYDPSMIGEWPARLENNWNKGDKALKKLLIQHMRKAAQCLPEHAREHLRTNTPIYINRSLKYGPAVCPEDGEGMCFHPDEGWLEENGMCKDKCGGIEIYKASEYKSDCELWGPGGVLLHELCHAYHHKMVPDGYDNKDIEKCYKEAMKEGLYDKVKVHGPQGPMAKAYACANAMEYFAELSVAFLGGLDKDTEYNKWQPFNRDELKKFDPRAYAMLQRVWKVNAD